MKWFRRNGGEIRSRVLWTIALATLTASSTVAGPGVTEVLGTRRGSGPVLQYAQNDAQYQAYDNYDLTGPNSRNLPGLELQACSKACQADSQCHAFSYDKWNHECFLKQSAGSFRFEPRSMSGVPANSTLPATANDDFTITCFAEKTFAPEDYKSVANLSFEQCQTSCEGDNDCVAFAHSAAGRACKLFQTTDQILSNREFNGGVKRQLGASVPKGESEFCARFADAPPKSSEAKLANAGATALPRERSDHMSDSNLVVRHQRCVIEAFVQNAKGARGFDPNLLQKSIGQCETLLEPLKKGILARTNDANFAEATAEKIRKASKRGVAVALTSLLARAR